MTNLPPIYSNMALSPDGSDKDKCTVVNLSVPGMKSDTTANDSFFNSLTASVTVAKLSSAYCAHNEMARPFLVPCLSKAGYSDSTSHSILATRPFSFIPSTTEISQALTARLPYLEVHSIERSEERRVGKECRAR